VAPARTSREYRGAGEALAAPNGDGSADSARRTRRRRSGRRSGGTARRG
jgi:hypothetical protein